MNKLNAIFVIAFLIAALIASAVVRHYQTRRRCYVWPDATVQCVDMVKP